ncbi:circadian clock KaiB family protein [Halomicronema sp. CCY15110]|uniref:circadian clock KaiB family protein n=1 Tax=Halomicronema sp. CCY15110 TaxID=2767773 RepID=UPI0019516D20|nr:circadian clock KaiB family protein [Halomicronema sp. CCY15110]
MSSSIHSLPPPAFKGIAVFTPGGDVVYCRDYEKRVQWHLNLCGALQEQLGLPESPHFLVPAFTATVDCWQNTATATTHIAAEAYPFVYHYQGLLNAIFDLGNLEWTRLRFDPDGLDLSVLETYRSRFPQLWENHNLVLDLSASPALTDQPTGTAELPNETTGTVLKLFVSGYSAATEQILTTLQRVLEGGRRQPYTLQMIDVSKHPEQAEADQVTATPTLVRAAPLPMRRLVGELDNPRAILTLLRDP